MDGYQKTTLDNGVRIVTEEISVVRSASLGIWVGAGARDETDAESGISHFLEHMMFKGTERRSAQEIAEALDDVGGQLNAFTDKEYTCYYAKVLGDKLGLAFDVLSDMLTGSVFDPVELEREKNVVLEEIKRHDDTPDELIHDIYSEVMWPHHPLGRRVIGRWDTVGALKRDDLLSYIAGHYTPDRIVIACAGYMRHDELVEAAQRVFGSLRGTYTPQTGELPKASFESRTISKETEQVHFCLGTPGFSQFNEEKYKLSMLDVILGGGMSSRLFQEIREKRGLAYAIGSYTNQYWDAGAFTIYAGTSPDQLDEVLAVVREEMARLVADGVSEQEIERAKSQVRGSLYLGMENTTNRMTRLGKSELYHGRFISPDEVVGKIEAVTADDVLKVARHLFTGGEAYAAIGPFAADLSVEGE